MTDAHAKAVEKAAYALTRHPAHGISVDAWRKAERAITAYLATMAEAGWVMARDVEVKTERQWIAGPLSLREASVQDLGREAGWNACRAAMLKGSTDGQG